jgi:hypothetical protein
MVLLSKATAPAEELFRYLQSDAARATLERYGFTIPER